MTTTPLAWSNLAGTLGWQLDHIQAALAGRAISDNPFIASGRVICFDVSPAITRIVARPPEVAIGDWARWNRPEMRDCILGALQSLGVRSRTQAIADAANRSLSATKSILYAGAATGYLKKTMVGRFAEWEIADNAGQQTGALQ